MHIGVSRPPAPDYPVPDIDGALVARAAERAGFESICYGEHPIRPIEAAGFGVHIGGVPHFQDLIVMLARASAVTERIKVGTGVCLVGGHNPLLLAKQLACIDHYSAGRLILGIGTGGSAAEMALLGADPERPWAQTGEAVRLMRMLWQQEAVEFHGEFFDIPPVQCFPQPAQKPTPPVLMGSKGPRAFERLVEYCDGWMPAFVTPEQIADGPAQIRAGLARIGELAEAASVPASRFTVTAILRGEVDRDMLARYAETGIERVVISLPEIAGPAEVDSTLARLAERVL